MNKIIGRYMSVKTFMFLYTLLVIFIIYKLVFI